MSFHIRSTFAIQKQLVWHGWIAIMNVSLSNRNHLATVACVGMLFVGCVRDIAQPTPTASTSVKALAPVPESREEQIGRRLTELQPGMSQQQVEEILGLPNAEVMHSAGLEGLAMTGYLCVLPDNPDAGNRLMVLYFDTTVNPPQFIEATGPHVPGEK